jgi:hypothetical protein
MKSYLFFMKLFLIFMIFLLSIPIVFAENITWGNISIQIPNITLPRTPNITWNQTKWNQTERIDVLEILRDLGITDLLEQRLKKVYEVVVDALVESIAQTLKELLPNIVEILITGNVTNRTSK